MQRVGRFSARVALALVLAVALAFGGARDADAQITSRYGANLHGGLTFTGNSLGLSSDGAQLPGTVGSIGAFITTDTSVSAGPTWPSGTTPIWTENSAAAQLRLPPGSVVTHAELIWGGHFDDLPAEVDAGVTLTTPTGTHVVNPLTPETSDIASGTASGTAPSLRHRDSAKDFYMNAVDVTDLVAPAGAGSYTVSGVPASLDCTSNCNLRSAGWTLAVAYEAAALPLRHLAIFAGMEPGGGEAATLDGLCTPTTGAVRARVLVSAMEGDHKGYGDNMAFGPPGEALTNLTGPNNNLGNFFAGHLNDDSGMVDTAGTFGDRNLGSTSTETGRYGWDITNVDASGILAAGATRAAAQGITSNEQYRITVVGVQIDAGQPIFEGPTSQATVAPASAPVGGELTLTWTWHNVGAEPANDSVFRAALPTGLAFKTGSVVVDGAPSAGADPAVGIVLGDLAPDAQVILSAVATVVAAPARPFSVQGALDWSWTTCGDVTSLGGAAIGTPMAGVPSLEAAMSATPEAAMISPGEPLGVTLNVDNYGTGASAGAWASVSIPSGLSYLPGTTRINGLEVSDLAGGIMPLAGGALIGGPGQGAGVIATGGAAVVKFSVVADATNAKRAVRLSALVDDDTSIAGVAASVFVDVAVTVCGDAITGGLEECDGGAANSDSVPNACRTDCRLPWCGDGIEDADEACDWGSEPAERCVYGELECQVCSDACGWIPGQANLCGDGELDADAGEECDDGTYNSDAATDACREDCKDAGCGDGVRDAGEECDDGNGIDGDACSDECVANLCGDGVVQVERGEVCDGGAGGDLPCDYGDKGCQRCGSDCQWIDGAASWCGDDVVDGLGGEQCDDGNDLTDACEYGDLSCMVCGAGCAVRAGVTTWCGDGEVDAFHGEACDDGNQRDGDGCDRFCQVDRSISTANDDGGCGLGSAGRGGPWLLALLALILMARRRRTATSARG